jgi:hypothetical protein
MTRVLLNLALYQLAWFGCVLGAAVREPAWGYATVSLAVLWHLGRAPKPMRESLLLLAVVAVGALFELLLVQSGWVSMAPELLVAGVLPLWMVALWAAFGTTLNIALRALRDRGGLVAVLALVGAPLAYAAGARLGAFEFNNPPFAIAAVAAGWALLLPLLLRAARRLDGYAMA